MVRAITDRVLVMQKGRIVEEGPTSQVLDAPQHAYARTLVESALHLDKAAGGEESRATGANRRELSTFLASSGVNSQYQPANSTGPAEMGVPDRKPEFDDRGRKAAGMPHLPSVWDGPMIAPKVEAVVDAVPVEPATSVELASEVKALALGESAEDLALEEQIARAEEVVIVPPPVPPEQQEPSSDLAPAGEAVLIDAANMAYFKAAGADIQKRINAALRAYIRAVSPENSDELGRYGRVDSGEGPEALQTPALPSARVRPRR